MDLFAAALSLVTAMIWGFVTQLQRRGLNFVDGRTGALIVVLSFAGLFWIMAPFLIEWHWFTHPSMWIFAISGVFVPGLAQQFTMMSIEKIGPTVTSVVAAFVPIFAVAPAILFLGENINFQAAIGIGLIVLGVVLAVRAKSQNVGSFPIILVWLAFAAAASRGFGQPISKLGLQDLPEPFFGTLVMVSASAIFIGGAQAIRDRQSIQFRYSVNLLWLVAAGSLLGIGFLLLYLALNMGGVVVVAPFIATMPIWVIFFDHLFFKHERIVLQHICAAIVVTVGSMILILR
jgi:drug/metabolite transporter (DMT)-like permease